MTVDPWMVSATEKVLSTTLKQPLMMVKSYMYQIKDMERETIDQLMSHQRDNGFYLRHRNSTHNVLTDMILYMPRELEIFDMLYNQEGIEDFHVTSFELYLAYFEVIGSEEMEGVSPRKQVEIVYERYLKRMAEKRPEFENPFSVEEF